MGKKKITRSLRRQPQKRLSPEQIEKFVLQGRYTFWLAHGANYLASSLERGLWQPLFNIYTGTLGESSERILLEVATRYQTLEGFSPPGPAILRWCNLKPAKVFGFYQELQEKATEKQRVHLCDPHVEYVWRAFQPLHHVRL